MEASVLAHFSSLESITERCSFLQPGEISVSSEIRVDTCSFVVFQLHRYGLAGSMQLEKDTGVVRILRNHRDSNTSKTGCLEMGVLVVWCGLGIFN